MTREQAIVRLKKCRDRCLDPRDSYDPGDAHGHADDVLTELLAHLGYGDVVESFHEVPKWYS